MKKTGNILVDFWLFFIAGVLVILPVEYYIAPFHKVWIQKIFGPFFSWIKTSIFGVDSTYHEISSDSSSMYVLFLFVVVLSIVLTTLVQLIPYWKIKRERLMLFSKIAATYFLSLQMLKYGLTKLTKGQFYLPEPNILYSNFGSLDKDILYWSTMGTSYSYNIFLGAVEVLAGVLLLHKKTRYFGAVMALGIMINVFMVNMSFDISVKLLSGFLLLIAFVLTFKNSVNLIQVFMGRNDAVVINYVTLESDKPYRKQLLKGTVICLILAEVFMPMINNGVYNDDKNERPFLHGAYEVMENGENDLQFDQLFIHRKGYLIFKNGEEMTDFHLEIDQARKKFMLTDYDYQQTVFKYEKSDNLLFLEINENNTVQLKKLNWQEMPALKNSFHWVVD